MKNTIAVFDMYGILISANGKSEMPLAICNVKSYTLCANIFGKWKPNGAVIAPIKTSVIIIMENIGNNTKFPIKLYVWILTKCAAINGAVNTDATNEVKTVA